MSVKIRMNKPLNESQEQKADIVICPNEIKDVKNKWKVFLAGPIQGAPEWQFNVPYIKDVVYLCPRRKSLHDENFNYDEQVNWETEALRMANVVLFWIPEPAEDIDGRSYAQTTRFELGENIARGKNIILGSYKDFAGRKYFDYKAKKYKNVLAVCNTFEDCISKLKDFIKSHDKTTWFTSDTHFGSERALELSKRPFTDVQNMDETMIERWNNVVGPFDDVYHLGDFGDETVAKHLTGNIHLLYGNYERDGKDEVIRKNFVEVIKKAGIYKFAAYELNNINLYLTHEPLNGKKYLKRHVDADFCLFGHIHGRQKIKEFGIDVGVDCNNYTPLNITDVLFFKNAIKKGYYDEEVFA